MSRRSLLERLRRVFRFGSRRPSVTRPDLPHLAPPPPPAIPDLTRFPSRCGNEVFETVPEYRKIEEYRRHGSGLRASVPIPSGTLQDFIPSLTDPVRILCVNFHVFRNAMGQGHFLVSETWRLTQILEWTNQRFAAPDVPSDPPSPPCPLIADTRIRFKLHRLEFYDDDALHVSISAGDLQAAALARNPSALDQLNVYFTAGVYGGASGFATLPAAFAGFDSWVVMLGYHAGTATDPNPGDYARSGTLAHEFGHTLDLMHTYPDVNAGAPADCTQGPEFLYDVFGTAPSTCPHQCNWGADASGPPPQITNNLMGGNKAAHWISGLQAARMHRALAQMSVGRYVADGCSDCVGCVAFTVSGTGHISQGSPTKLPYPIVDLNESWGWTAGGEFVAPVRGIYHFDLSFVRDSYYQGGTTDDVYVDVVRNDVLSSPLATAWSGHGAGQRGTGCVSLNVRLQTGDRISTSVRSPGSGNQHLALYTFAGHLICSHC